MEKLSSLMFENDARSLTLHQGIVSCSTLVGSGFTFKYWISVKKLASLIFDNNARSLTLKLTLGWL